MSYHVFVLRQAEDDAQSIVDWLNQRSPTGALHWFEVYLKTIHSLQEMPDRFGTAPESPYRGHIIRPALFRTPRGRNYRLLFTIAGNEVRIMHVRGPGQRLINE